MEIKTLESDNFILDADVEVQYLISLKKYIILSVLTLGLYGFWWMYKAWRFIMQKEKTDIMPALRVLLSVFFVFSLFRKILRFAKEKGYKRRYSSVLLYICFFILNFSALLPDPYTYISILCCILFIPPFNALNYAKRNSTVYTIIEQSSFNRRQKVLIVFGSIFWPFLLLGSALILLNY